MSKVIDARTREETELAQVLTSLQEQHKTGTLKLVGEDNRVKYVYFKRGTVELLKTNRSRTLIGKALLKRHKLTEEQLSAALERQKAATNNLRLGEILVGMAIVKESDVHQALAYQIAEEIFELFTWPEMESEFFRGEPPLDIFESEDLQARVSLSPVQLASEAIRRQNELAEIRRTIPSKRDVYAPTQKAYRPENEQHPAIAEVLSCLDGQRTVEDLLDVARAPDLVALRVLVKMVQEGDAVPLSAQELLALGMTLEERNEFLRARVCYLRAEELGHPDFDLPRRIGQLAEALGDLPEACRRYCIYADRCDQAGYPDVAGQTLQRVLELDPDQRKARERYAELMLKTARAQREAGEPSDQLERAAGEQYLALLTGATVVEDQKRILEELVQLYPDREDLREQMAQISLDSGDHAQAVIELEELATNALAAGNLERAVNILEKIVSIDTNDILTVKSLADTYAKLGRKDDAVRQYMGLAKSLEESGLAAASADTMVDINERIVQLDPENTQARRFLATAYEGKKNSAKAVKNLTRMVESLRKRGDENELLEALEKLCVLDPSNLDVALERTRLATKLGHGQGDATSVLRSVAESAQLSGESATALRAWKELLAANPGDLDGQLSLAKMQVQHKEHDEAAKRCAAAFELAMLSGAEELAYEAVKQALDIEPDNPHHRERLARIQAVRGQTEQAAKTLVRAARRARDDEDLGVSRSWARKALKLDAECDDAQDLLDNLRRTRLGDTPNEPERRGPTVQATITGGGSGGPEIEGVKTKAKRVGNIADRLRSMKLGTPAAPRPNSSETKVMSRKASSAMNKLRAMKSGGVSSGSAPALDESKKASKGPEAPGEAADTKVSKKAGSALNKLKAMRGGGGGGGSGERKKASKGPEAPGEAADTKVSKKAGSALNKLKAMRSGGGGSSPSGESKKVSKGPEAPGAAADTKVSKKAGSALNKLKAMRSGGGGSSPAAKTASKGPEAPGEAADTKVSKKAGSAMDRLKALRSGGGAPAASSKPASKGPEAPGEAADTKVSKKAGSAMDRLKALRAGGGKAAPSKDKKVSKGPEAPGEAADEQVSKKASSAMDRLKALRSGGQG